MALTAAEVARVESIEKVVNKLQETVKLLASQKQLRTLVVLKQKEIDDLTARVASLEAQLVLLQNNS